MDRRATLRTEPFDEHIDAEVDALWRTEVSPALSEIRQAMADHGLAREVLRAFGDYTSSFVDGTWLRLCSPRYGCSRCQS